MIEQLQARLQVSPLFKSVRLTDRREVVDTEPDAEQVPAVVVAPGDNDYGPSDRDRFRQSVTETWVVFLYCPIVEAAALEREVVRRLAGYSPDGQTHGLEAVNSTVTTVKGRFIQRAITVASKGYFTPY